MTEMNMSEPLVSIEDRFDVLQTLIEELYAKVSELQEGQDELLEKISDLGMGYGTGFGTEVVE